MEEQENTRRFSFSTIAGISAASLIGVCAITGLLAWYLLISSNSSSNRTVPSSNNTIESPQTQSKEIEGKKAQVYWVETKDNEIELSPSSITVEQEKAAQPKEILDSAFKRLLAGPTEPDLATSIPQGTKLKGIEIKDDGIHVNLSQEFSYGGGSASMMSRVAQVLHTATSLDKEAQVWLEIEGEPLEVLGGEGLVLEQPLTRESFKENFEF